MSSVVPLRPVPADVDSAWERHRVLASASIADPRLRINRRHMEASAIAYRDFYSLFLRSLTSDQEGVR